MGQLILDLRLAIDPINTGVQADVSSKSGYEPF